MNDVIPTSTLFDRNSVERLVNCYRLDYQLLLVELNRSKNIPSTYKMFNLTVFDYQDQLLLSESSTYLDDSLRNQHFQSFIYRLKRRSPSFKIKYSLQFDETDQVETLSKHCDDFYPIYSPLTCSIKSSGLNNHHLSLQMPIYRKEKHIQTLKPNFVYYRTNRLHTIKKNIFDIPKVRRRLTQIIFLEDIVKSSFFLLASHSKRHRPER